MPALKRALLVSSVIAPVLAPVAWRWWKHHQATAHGTRVVALETAAPLVGVRAEARDVVSLAVVASAVTDSSGSFRFSGVDVDEVGLWLDGSPAGREKGYASADGGVTATWGEAVSWDPGSLPAQVRLGPA